MERLGEVAAFGTAIFWTASALVFDGASRRIGALAVNFWKVVGALLLLSIAGLATRGMALPLDASATSWFFLSLSGIIGFVIADYFLFTAYVMIGSRITVVFQALTPLITAGFGWLFLREGMDPRSMAGMATVIAGILILVLSRNRGPKGLIVNKTGAKGYVFALLSAIFQALGLVTSKLGLAGIDAISATQIRVIVAIAGFGIQALILGRWRQVFVEPLHDRVAIVRVAAGAVVGPFLGVVLSLYALQHTSAGSASTLMALTPVLIIPPSMLLLRQKVAPLEILGAVVAVTGTAMFFLL